MLRASAGAVIGSSAMARPGPPLREVARREGLQPAERLVLPEGQARPVGRVSWALPADPRETGEVGVEVEFADRAARAQIVRPAVDRVLGDGVEVVVELDPAVARDGERELFDGHVADSEIRMRADGPRGATPRGSRPRASRSARPRAVRSEPRCRAERPAVLGVDRRAQGDRGIRALSLAIGGVTQQPVDRIAQLGIRHVEALRLTVEQPGSRAPGWATAP